MGQVLVKDYQEYVTKQGDTYDALALDAYDDERMASHIIQANLQYMDTLIFDAGIKLRLPVLDNIERPATLPPWRR
ncbi:MAG: LysM domain-containing protein [Lachnospiraceae bacterium]|nr:LysM domain-containing protein [Lachnospiraceae bacterium]MDE7204062.1 LysM domain-containing protein [Lachnospiraceae bacterium]